MPGGGEGMLKLQFDWYITSHFILFCTIYHISTLTESNAKLHFCTALVFFYFYHYCTINKGNVLTGGAQHVAVQPKMDPAKAKIAEA